MAVKLSVIVPGTSYHQDWWVNFCRAEVNLVSGPEQNFHHPLSEWGGKNIAGKCIEFENDSDATVFVLRWS